MNEIVPTPGRIVWYRLSDNDVVAIRKRRGAAYHGNEVDTGDLLPAMVIRAWGDKPDSSVNLKVFLDGDDSHWVTSRSLGTLPGTYQWMPYQIGQAAKATAESAEAKAS